jgi:hypothetical protein
VLAALGLAFFFAPALAFVVGERAERIENRRLAAFPSLSRGFNVFDDLTQWGVDHLPLRDTAVRVHSDVTRELFGEVNVSRPVAAAPVGLGQSGALGGEPKVSQDRASARGVVVGRDGWLFIEEEFQEACHPGHAPSGVIASAARLADILRRSGRELVLAIPPDKGSMVPGLVPDGYALKGCSERARARRMAALRAARISGFVDLQAVLTRVQRRRGFPLYLQADTHWSDLGGAVAAQAIARRVEPRVMRGTKIVRFPDEKEVEDLAYMVGDQTPRVQERYSAVRRGVTHTEFATPDRDRRSKTSRQPGAASVYRPRTLMVGDSFAQGSFGQYGPYFADLTLLPMPATFSRRSIGRDERKLLEQIRRAHLFILMKNERGFWSRERIAVLSDAFLDRLERELAPGAR